MDNTKKRITAIGDLAFKKVFASIGNEDIIAGLISDFFGFIPTGVTITNPYNIQTYDSELRKHGGDFNALKETLNDVGVELSNGDFIVEAQIKKLNVYGKRSLYYSFSRFCNNYDRNGNKYDDLRSVYSLNILKESYFTGDDVATRVFRLYDDCDKIPIDRDYIRIGYFELLKTELRNEHQRFWQMYFLDRNVPPEAPEYIRRAGKLIEIANLGKEERYMLSLEEKYAADQHALFSTARSEGMAEGMVKVARKLKDEGAVMSLIVKVTGLSEQEIEAL